MTVKRLISKQISCRESILYFGGIWIKRFYQMKCKMAKFLFDFVEVGVVWINNLGNILVNSPISVSLFEPEYMYFMV